MERLRQVGTVGKPHGVRGEVKVIPNVEEPAWLERIPWLFVGDSEEMAEPLEVERLRYQQSSKGLTLLLKFVGFETPEAVARLRRQAVLVREADFPFEESEGPVVDLIGFDVVSPSGEHLGTLTQILEMPAQQIYEVTDEAGRVTLVPVVDEFVREVDAEGRRVIVDPIEGLFE